MVLPVLAPWLLPGQTTRARPSHASLLFHQQRSLETIPAFIAEHIEAIEALPFEGITIDIDASLTLMRGQPIAYAEMYDDELALLKGKFTRMDQNFVMVYIDDPGDLFDEPAWDVTVENWRNLARAARDAGLKGIMFDNEPYRDAWFNFPEDYRSPQHSLQKYARKTQQRGRQIMEAMVEEFPAIDVIILHGPYASEPKTPATVRRNQAGLASERELNGPFFVGFVEGMGDQARVIDGGEQYQYRSASDFETSYQWRKYDLPSDATDSQFIPADVRAIWADRVSIAFGQSTEPYAGVAMDAEIMRTTLANALTRADDYVWFYTHHDAWMEPGGFPKAWLDAIRDAVAAAREGKDAAQDTSPLKHRRHRHG